MNCTAYFGIFIQPICGNDTTFLLITLRHQHNNQYSMKITGDEVLNSLVMGEINVIFRSILFA